MRVSRKEISVPILGIAKGTFRFLWLRHDGHSGIEKGKSERDYIVSSRLSHVEARLFPSAVLLNDSERAVVSIRHADNFHTPQMLV